MCHHWSSSRRSQDEEDGQDPPAMADLLSQLAAGVGPGTPLRHLAVNRDGHFVLRSGCLIAAERLLQPANVARAVAAGLVVQEWEGTRGACVLLTPS